MAGDDVKQVLYAMDIDDAEFVKKVLQAKASLKSLGDKGNLSKTLDGFDKIKDSVSDLADSGIPSILNGLVKMKGPIAAVVAGGLAVKAAFDLSLEAEEINAINQRFEILTQNAGISSAALREGITSVTAGLVDEEEALQAANEAILKLGTSAEKIPETFALAAKVSKAMGVDTKEAFDTLTQGIATGNNRILKRIGLSLDAKKAEEEYAKSIGVSVAALSEEGKIQARMNAVLAQGTDKLKGIETAAKPLTMAIKAAKLAFDDFGDTIALIIGPRVTGAFQSFFGMVKTGLDNTSRFLNENFGSAAAKANAKTEGLKIEIRELESSLKGMREAGVGPAGRAGAQLKFVEEQLTKKRNELQTIEERAQEAEQRSFQRKVQTPSERGGKGADGVDREKQLALEAEFQAKLFELKKKSNEDAMQMATQEEQYIVAANERKLLLEQEFENRKNVIKHDPKFSEAQRSQMIEQLSVQHNNDLLRIERDSLDGRKKAWDNYAQHATGKLNQLARVAQAQSAKASLDLTKGTKAAEMAFDDLGAMSTDVFMGIGEAAAGGTDAVKKAFLGGLGTMAINQGKFMALAGLLPPNPAALAGGAALIALGGFLKGQAGGGGGDGGAGGGSGGGGGGTSYADSGAANYGISEQDYNRAMETKRLEQERNSLQGLGLLPEDPATAVSTPEISTKSVARAQKSLIVQVQGSVLDMDTKTRLVDMIREATDATDYKYYQIGAKGT